MKKAIIIICTVLIHLSVNAQRTEITADSLLHYLQQAEDIYSCFDSENDPVIRGFRDYKNMYFNDTLRHLLVNLFNDSIEWARYTAKGIRQYYENKPDDKKRMSLEGYLEHNYKKAFVDSVLNNKKLFAQYYDSLCVYKEESSFEEDMKKRGTWNVPYSLKNIIVQSHFPEVYNKMLYYWKSSGCYYSDFDFNYLLEVDSPELLSSFESQLDKNDLTNIYFLLDYMCSYYRSASIRMLIKYLDKTDLIGPFFYRFDFDIPFNVSILLTIIDFSDDFHKEWFFRVYNIDNYDIIYDYESMKNQVKTVKTQKQAIKMSQYIIEHKDLIIPFFEQHYQKCLQEEFYWKQNMPYYKKE
ncbi:MAG: hypothetical protein IKQ70_03670 [Bacteroidales bacterium]|nr:hypothetical protein [Bacteroidales bacterium]